MLYVLWKQHCTELQLEEASQNAASKPEKHKEEGLGISELLMPVCGVSVNWSFASL